MIPNEIKQIFKGSKIGQFDPYFSEVVEYCELTNERRLAQFFAQTGVESQYYTKFVENLMYSAQGLANTWPKLYAVNPLSKIKVPNKLAISIQKKPELIASTSYENKNGNGNFESRDGWKYIGRGTIQLTGKSNYRDFTDNLGVFLSNDFVKYPDAVIEPKNSLYAGAFYWRKNKLNLFADKQDIKGATRKINGGNSHLAERTDLYNKIIKVL